MSLLEDLLREDLTVDNRKLIVRHIFTSSFTEAFSRQDIERSRSIGSAKSLSGFYDLVRLAIGDYETRSGVTEENKIFFTEEEPDVDAEHESIVFSLIKRVPGAFGKGAPFEASVTNQRPMLRGSEVDPENPDYMQVTYGYWHDNIVRFTCWARTNKSANARAAWFEDLMEEYSWWYKLQGVDRVLFLERQADISTVVNSNKWYGRSIDYFIRTETLKVYNEKRLEEILLNVSVTR
jgi:hypothetical protein